MQELPCVRGMSCHLLYVFRMMSKMARMIIMPMTITAIIAPEPERDGERRHKQWQVVTSSYTRSCSWWWHLFSISMSRELWPSNSKGINSTTGKYFVLNACLPHPQKVSRSDSVTLLIYHLIVSYLILPSIKDILIMSATKNNLIHRGVFHWLCG